MVIHSDGGVFDGCVSGRFVVSRETICRGVWCLLSVVQQFEAGLRSSLYLI